MLLSYIKLVILYQLLMAMPRIILIGHKLFLLAVVMGWGDDSHTRDQRKWAKKEYIDEYLAKAKRTAKIKALRKFNRHYVDVAEYIASLTWAKSYCVNSMYPLDIVNYKVFQHYYPAWRETFIVTVIHQLTLLCYDTTDALAVKRRAYAIFLLDQLDEINLWSNDND